MSKPPESSWWAYQDNKSKPDVPPAPPNADVVEKLSGIASDATMEAHVTTIEAEHDNSFMETTRTFALRVRKYWGMK